MSVDIGTEVDKIAVDPSSHIGDVHGQRTLQVHNRVLGRGNHLVDPVSIPTRNASRTKDLFSQIERPREPDASMAESPHISAEQAARWTVVQIDVVFVWKHQLYLTQCVIGARPLSNLKWEIPTSISGPVD